MGFSSVKFGLILLVVVGVPFFPLPLLSGVISNSSSSSSSSSSWLIRLVDPALILSIPKNEFSSFFLSSVFLFSSLYSSDGRLCSKSISANSSSESSS